MNNLDWEIIEHFKASEFACRCGNCGSTGDEMDVDFVGKLDQLREQHKFPLVITSGYRCPAYNASISSTGEDGPHTTGHAADVAISGERAFFLVIRSKLSGWITGIGINQRGDYAKRFIHLDDLDGATRPRLWTY